MPPQLPRRHCTLSMRYGDARFRMSGDVEDVQRMYHEWASRLPPDPRLLARIQAATARLKRNQGTLARVVSSIQLE